MAGLFYSANPRVLRREVESMLEEAAGHLTPPPGSIIGAIVPHAGYPYSGPTAARAFKALAARDIGTVVLVGPSHRDLFPGASIYPGDAFSTPLGEVEVDRDLVAAIGSSGRIALRTEGHREEHALEVQLPFIQCSHPHARIVAITMCDQGRRTCEAVAETLSEALKGRDAVVVASSDLSHYHPYDEAVGLDGRVAEFIGAFNDDDLLLSLESESVEACGGGPVVAAMRTSRALGARRATILHQCNSGDVTGDRSGVVGYLSALLTT